MSNLEILGYHGCDLLGFINDVHIFILEEVGVFEVFIYVVSGVLGQVRAVSVLLLLLLFLGFAELEGFASFG